MINGYQLGVSGTNWVIMIIMMSSHNYLQPRVQHFYFLLHSDVQVTYNFLKILTEYHEFSVNPFYVQDIKDISTYYLKAGR